MTDKNGIEIKAGAECKFRFGRDWLKATVVAVNNEGTRFESVTIEAEPSSLLGTSTFRTEWPRNIAVRLYSPVENAEAFAMLDEAIALDTENLWIDPVEAVPYAWTSFDGAKHALTVLRANGIECVTVRVGTAQCWHIAQSKDSRSLLVSQWAVGNSLRHLNIY